MRIKKYEAYTLQEALARIKKDFGPEAVILHTKKYKKGGVFGLFGREMTEVTAGIDINVDRPKQQSQAQPVYEKPSQSYPAYNNQTSFRPASRLTSQAGPVIAPRLEPMVPAYNRVEDISMKNENLARELSQGKVSVVGSVRPVRESGNTSASGAILKSGIGRIQKMLIENGDRKSVV
jgi:flagellar biosynthesis GTPase FlhF